MARRVLFIDSKTISALGGSAILNADGINNPSFIVEALLVRNGITLSGTPAGTLGATDVGSAQIQAFWKKTSQLWLNALSFRSLDLYCKRKRLPSAQAFDVLADQTAAEQTHQFDFLVPVKQPRAARPADFEQALSEIGQIQVSCPAALAPVTAGMTFGGWTTEIYAIGRDAKPGEYSAGAQVRVDEVAGVTGLSVDVRAHGYKVKDLFGFTVDTSGSPISGNTGPSVYFDGRQTVDFRTLNAQLTPYAWGDLTSADDYSDFTSAGVYQNALVEDLAPASWLNKISRDEPVNVIRINYSAHAVGTDQRYVLETLYPSQAPAVLKQRVPGAESIPTDTMAKIATQPGANGGRSTVADAYAPARVKV